MLKISLLFVCLLTACAATVPPAQPVAIAHNNAKQTILLMTHPRVHVLKSYVHLVRSGMLDVPNLHIVAIYHADQRQFYEEGTAYLAEQKIDWITLKSIDCHITQNDMYSNNACSAAFDDLLQHSSGLILNGGADIPPAFYGKPTEFVTMIHTPKRSMFELSLLTHLLGTQRNQSIKPFLAQHRNYPVLGICLGMQSMNVADGGTMLQDIPSEVYHMHSFEEELHVNSNYMHRNAAYYLNPDNPNIAEYVLHPVTLHKNIPTAWQAVFSSSKEQPYVLSAHHQAIDKLGADYSVIAKSIDSKVIEAIQHRIYPHVRGVQFHPEIDALWDANQIFQHDVDSQEKNIAYHTMQEKPISAAFGRAIWSHFAQLLQAYQTSP